jgi:fructose-bisphosphate aldolase class I
MAWQGKPENTVAAQQALVKRARLNHFAMKGEYNKEMEQEE